MESNPRLFYDLAFITNLVVPEALQRNITANAAGLGQYTVPSAASVQWTTTTHFSTPELVQRLSFVLSGLPEILFIQAGFFVLPFALFVCTGRIGKRILFGRLDSLEKLVLVWVALLLACLAACISTTLHHCDEAALVFLVTMSLAAIGAFIVIAHEVLADGRIPPVYVVGVYLAWYYLTLLGLVFGLSLMRIMGVFVFVAYLELNARYGDRFPNLAGFARLGDFFAREMLERLLL